MLPAPSPARPGTGRDAPLFRQEVVVDRQTQWLGTVLLIPRRSHQLFTIFALAVIVGIVALLCFGHYTRKARINGLLVPNLGLVQVVAPQDGVVAKVFVKEGDKVAAGAPLVLLSGEIHTPGIGATREQVVRQLHDRHHSLIGERTRQKELYADQLREGTARLAAASAERQQLQHAIKLQQQRVQLAHHILRQMEVLRVRQLVTEQRLQGAEQDSLDQAIRLRSYRQNLASLDREIAQLHATVQQLPLREQMQIGDTDRKVAAIEQDLAEAEARRQILLTAPQAGTIGAIQATIGTPVNTKVPLVSIVPAGSVLQAQLFSPSRAIGFVRRGQRVLLRYEAFPYQKFGFYEGTVAAVSHAALSPAELPRQLEGLTSLYGATEPLYRITVNLAQQTATAYGKPVRLQPGMRLNADVMIERKSLLEWIFDPLYTLTGGSKR